MQKAQEIQRKFFDQVKIRVPEHLSMVEQVAGLLGKSIDSCYRRIRGEKMLSFDELHSLCLYFNVSFDKLLDDSIHELPISYVSVNENGFNVNGYLQVLEKYLTGLQSATEKEAIYISNDLPLFQVFQVPELARFKFFFWQKTSLNFEQFRDRKFNLKDSNPELVSQCQKVYSLYQRVPSLEVIGKLPVESFIRQIDYYLESGFFENRQDAVVLCNRLIDLIDHLNSEAQLGMKYPLGQQPGGTPDNFKLFTNDLFMVDAIILVRADSECRTFITTNPLNYIQTENQAFYQSYHEWVMNLLEKCERLTDTSEKQRNRYFIDQVKQVSDFRDQI